MRLSKSESTAQLADALSKAQGAIKGAIKDSTNPYYKSRYADLASVWDACRKELSDNGLAVIQAPFANGGKIGVDTLIMHTSGEWVCGELELTPVKDDPQGAGSVITYIKRYCLSGFAGIAPEDDDGNAASGKAHGTVLDVPRTEEDIPLTKSNGTDTRSLPPESERITVEQQKKLHMRFRESLREEIRHSADALLYDFLGAKLYLDEQGNPSASAILKAEYANVGRAAVAHAKEL